VSGSIIQERAPGKRFGNVPVGEFHRGQPPRLQRIAARQQPG
jgi:hypothetical protein